MWEEGAWENRPWMQIWSFYSPAPRPLPAQPQLCPSPCQKGKCFEGFVKKQVSSVQLLSCVRLFATP